MRCTTAIADHLKAILATEHGLRSRIARITRMIDQHVAIGEDDTDAIQDLRYRSFRREGATERRADARLRDRFDASANMFNCGLWFEGHLCAAIRLHVIDRGAWESPACSVFPDLLLPLVEAGERLIDPNCFCVDPLLAGNIPEFAYMTLRLPFIAAGLRARSSVTATVRTEHSAFYRRVLRCQAIATPRPYPGRNRPLGLMLVSYDEEAARVIDRYPFFAANYDEAALIGFDRTIEPTRELVWA